MRLFLYKRIKKYVFHLDTVTVAMLQHKFNIGYAKASEMMDRLEDDGRIMQSNGKWYVLYGIHLRTPDDIVRISMLPEANADFTEENVLRLLEEKGFISTSLIQRRFSVGYAKAARMIDTLAEKGYVKHDGRRWIKAR